MPHRRRLPKSSCAERMRHEMSAVADVHVAAGVQLAVADRAIGASQTASSRCARLTDGEFEWVGV